MTVIKEAHINFARAIVKLAREHEMDKLELSFDQNFNTREIGSETVTMTWKEGRHGANNYLSLSYHARMGVSEKEEKQNHG